MLPTPESLIVALTRAVTEETGFFFDRAAQEKLESHLRHTLVAHGPWPEEVAHEQLTRIMKRIFNQVEGMKAANGNGRSGT